MTAFVRSLFAKRNPRNVPLDIYDTGGPPPSPDWFKRPDDTLTREEREFRDRAIKQYTERLYDTHDARRADARERYTEILAEIVRGIGETAHRIQSSGALARGHLEAKEWTKLGQDLALMFRDAAAAIYIDYVLTNDLFMPGKTLKIPIGKKTGTHVTGEQLQSAFEERVVLIEQWIVARAAFEARGEIAAARVIKPTNQAAAARDGIDRVEKHVTKVQAGIVAGHIRPKDRARSTVMVSVWEIFDGMTDALKILNDPGLHTDVDDLLETPVKTLRAGLKNAQKLATKGEPKITRAESLRAQAKENPFVYSILR